MTLSQHLLICALIACTRTLADTCDGDEEVCAHTSLLQTGVMLHQQTGEQSFAAYVAEHARSYTEGTEEYSMRQSIYAHRLQKVKEQNSIPGRLWDAGINHLSDRTDLELSRLKGLRPIHTAKAAKGSQSTGNLLVQQAEFVAPDSKDWTQLKAVKQARDQKSCGSCWALATSVTLQANAEINGYDRTFSPQELVDCVPNPHKCGGDGGCKGSTVELAMNWVMEQGLADLKTTPYEGSDGTCKKEVAKEDPIYLLQGDNDDDDHYEDMVKIGFHGPKSQSSPGVKLGLSGWTRLEENKYLPLLNAVANGPVATSLSADGFTGYSSGIFDGCEKDAVVNHAVTIVGYGKSTDNVDQSTKLYWTIKNSWGNSWGEEGLIRMLRIDHDNHCGTDNEPEIGTGCVGGPKSVRICGMCGIHYDNVAMHFNKKEI